ncbi:MAG TPA: ornithine carbamoyltransferase [Rubrivivax sp.]|nr:ornithine carbamoyltransferase [Rubrivivax sp.]
MSSPAIAAALSSGTAIPALWELATVLARAKALAGAACQGAALPALRGKNIGLVSAAPHGGDAELLRSAAAGLGVQVAHVRPSLGEGSSAEEVADTARLLGRLYDAIDLPGLSPALVSRVAAAAGIPVFDGIASAIHPSAALAHQLVGLPEADARRFVLQALLLTALS